MTPRSKSPSAKLLSTKTSAVVEPEVSKPTIPKPPIPVESATQLSHELECLIQRRLQTHAGLKFSRLTVHKCPQGVCLEGTLETNDEGLDLCELVREIADINAINRVVMRPTKPK